MQNRKAFTIIEALIIIAIIGIILAIAIPQFYKDKEEKANNQYNIPKQLADNVYFISALSGRGTENYLSKDDVVEINNSIIRLTGDNRVVKDIEATDS